MTNIDPLQCWIIHLIRRASGTQQGGGQPWGIMEPLYSEEHLQNRAIYARTLSGTGTAAESNHLMWRIGQRWPNPWRTFIRRKYSFNDSVQPSWAARCRWINCLKSRRETSFLSSPLQAQQTQKKEDTGRHNHTHGFKEEKARRGDRLRKAKAMNDTRR